jgi:hypothetical protein
MPRSGTDLNFSSTKLQNFKSHDTKRKINSKLINFFFKFNQFWQYIHYAGHGGEASVPRPHQKAGAA